MTPTLTTATAISIAGTAAAATGSGRRAGEVVAETLATHPGRTAAQLAQLAGLGASTVTKALAELERAGLARRHTRHAAGEGGRRPAACWQPLPAAPPTNGSAGPAPGKRSTATKDRTAPPAQTTPQQAPRAAGAAGADASTDDDAVRGPSGRLGKGELSGLVLEYLIAHPGDDLGPTAIGTALQRSQGAVANCLSKLAEVGDIVQTGEHPRRYRLAS